jgi:hypothetical protein
MENNQIYEIVENYGSWAMSDFQSRYFVVNSQVTNYRRVRQALLEIETRLAAKRQIERNVWKTNTQIKIVNRDIENETDELKKELLLIELDQFNYDLNVYERKYKVCMEELDNFAKIIKDIVPTVDDLKSYEKHDEVEERNYWITRMAKQAAMDLMSQGRIGQGNLDSIAMMPLHDQEETIKAALKYNTVLNRGIGVLEKKALEELEMSQNKPGDMNYIDDVVKQQLKIENKNQGENI